MLLLDTACICTCRKIALIRPFTSHSTLVLKYICWCICVPGIVDQCCEMSTYTLVCSCAHQQSELPIVTAAALEGLALVLLLPPPLLLHLYL
jgi:hypothetical protein